jgi:hypothetical protein
MLKYLKERFNAGKIDEKDCIELIENCKFNNSDEQREAALIKHIYDCEGELVFDIRHEYDPNVYSANGNEYMVLTENEANDECFRYFEESLWAFNPSFLSFNTDLPEEVFEVLQERCEASSDAVLKLVEKCGNIDDLVTEAVAVDGRGPFLSGYDGKENEVYINGTWVYIYRMC